MSLLGIAIDPKENQARLESTHGFIERKGSMDEELLKLIGAIVLDGSVMKIKYKKEEVAAFLNWVADGKKPEDLPSLAKRLLCLKREKLRRGVQDPAFANSFRGNANTMIAEIDAILKNPASIVECVVEIEKEKCTEKPIATDPATAPAPAPAPAVVEAGSPGDDTKEPVVQPMSLSVSDNLTTTPVDNVGEAKPAESSDFDAVVTELATILRESENDKIRKECVYIIAHLFDNRQALLPQALISYLDVLKGDKQISDKLLILINQLAIIIPEVEKPAAAVVQESINKAVQKAIGPRRYTCSEKVGCLQQLVYASCGGASMLDPLVDHLDKLRATIATLPEQAAKISQLNTLLSNLRSHIADKQIELKYPLKDSSITRNIVGEEGYNGADQILSDIDNKYARLAKGNTKRIAELESIDNPEVQRLQIFEELEEEKRLLLNFQQILDATSDQDIYTKTKEYLSNIDAALSSLKTSKNVLSVRTECGVRASYYRAELAKAKEQESAACDEKVAAAMRTAVEQEAASSAKIAELEAQLVALKADCDTMLQAAKEAAANAERKSTNLATSHAAELDALRAAAASANTRKNASEQANTNARATIASLTEELGKAKKEAVDCQEKLVAANASATAKNANLAASKALAAVKNANLAASKELAAAKNASKDKVISEMQAQLDKYMEEAEAIKAELEAEKAGRTSNVDKARANVAAATTNIERLQGDLVNRATELEALKGKGAVNSDELAKAAARIAELQAALAELTRDCDELKKSSATIAKKPTPASASSYTKSILAGARGEGTYEKIRRALEAFTQQYKIPGDTLIKKWETLTEQQKKEFQIILDETGTLKAGADPTRLNTLIRGLKKGGGTQKNKTFARKTRKTRR